ncbi:MAG: hypothetical protein QF741_04735 [Candidatus Peribacteraceae bacterium]|jgi:hypothetical protein|nr:hypothetical protein [Candidatus Peribacteraceae bacterium]MDP7454382.1 hypothetical protein [Candidatus Peribacteraceae bacterium]|tara:strand:- start:32 stop:493 length:462 start_codon:yes stop_codon:yes gene_type:complete
MPPKEKKEIGVGDESQEGVPAHVRRYKSLERDLDEAVKNAKVEGKSGDELDNDPEVVRCNEAIEDLFAMLSPKQVTEIHAYFSQQRVKERVRQESSFVGKAVEGTLNYGVVIPVRAAVGPIANLTEEATKLVTRTFIGFFRGIGRGWSGRNAA